jgi:predicted acylesterase/phospholipase RssA
MTDTHTQAGAQPGAPLLQCDVVMKGGITSGVIYPGALERLSRTYRFRGLGGASAGAIGAVLAAAAEHGRANGAFERLGELPGELGDGKLMGLFQAERKTRPVLRIMMAATSAKGSKVFAVIRAVLRSFPITCLVGVAPGLAAIVFGATQSGGVAVTMIVLGVLAMLVGLLGAVLVRACFVMTRHITRNNFGICTGLRLAGATGPGFTDWMSQKIDDLAGVKSPLTFGQLWTGSDESRDVPPRERDVDLRMVTTCLSESQPFELPSSQGRYFFDAEEWSRLFPEPVVAHLVAHHRDGEAEEDARLASHDPPLTRMPQPEHLPVIVATRMSLSFPLLISAIPMWTIDRRKDEFVKVWFTDGGLCNNFPVQLFDAALPTRPTFAINLGKFTVDTDEQDDEVSNVGFAKDNRSGIAPRVSRIPTTGLGALTGFAGQAFRTARTWYDMSQLDQPGYRDRIFEVLQTKAQGGMNLNMPGPTIKRLADRGAAAAEAMVDRFTKPHYRDTFTGWDNHRWIRYRATLASFPDWLASFQRGFGLLEIHPPKTPSFDVDNDGAELASTIATALTKLADEIGANQHLAGLVADPRPKTVLRRVPQL